MVSVACFYKGSRWLGQRLVYDQSELLFTQRGLRQQRGWQTVLIPTNIRTGKNTIQISLQKDSPAKPEEITTIPFWYVPDK